MGLLENIQKDLQRWRNTEYNSDDEMELEKTAICKRWLPKLEASIKDAERRLQENRKSKCSSVVEPIKKAVQRVILGEISELNSVYTLFKDHLSQ